MLWSYSLNALRIVQCEMWEFQQIVMYRGRCLNFNITHQFHWIILWCGSCRTADFCLVSWKSSRIRRPTSSTPHRRPTRSNRTSRTRLFVFFEPRSCGSSPGITGRSEQPTNKISSFARHCRWIAAHSCCFDYLIPYSLTHWIRVNKFLTSFFFIFIYNYEYD